MFDTEIHGFIRREEMEDGRVLLTLTDLVSGEILMKSWLAAPQKKRQGSKSRYCIGKRFDELTQGQRDALLNLRSRMKADGRISSRRKHLLGRREELVSLLGSEYILKSLISVGAISLREERYFVDRSFLFRG
jgi:hypothetical protein